MAVRPRSRLVLLLLVGLLLGTLGTWEVVRDPSAGPGGPVERAAASVSGPSKVRPVGLPGRRWRLVFRDEFRGTRLDLDKWRPNWLANNDRAVTKPVNSAEIAAYDPRQVRVARGTLRLRAVKRATVDNRGRRYRYASGLVQTFHDHQFRYGYVEARIFLRANTERSRGRVGSCGPNWPAFWLNGEQHPEDGEIDIMECLGDNVAWHYHWSGGSVGGYPDRWSGRMPGGGGWHTFGVRWLPGRLAFFYDGRKVGSHRTGVTGSRHYIILNNGISRPERRLPATLKVDYVRVWKKPRS